MGNKLQVFENDQFGEIRTVIIDGEPWFVGKDAADILGYSNSRKAIADHVDDEDKTDGVTIRDAIGREQNPVLVNESGLYSLIFSSKLPEAKKFKRWVTNEVLPTLRKTGAYSVSGATLAPAPVVPLGALVRLMEFQERNMKERGCTPYEIAAVASGIMKAYGVVLVKGFTSGTDPQMSMFDAPALPTDAVMIPA